MKTLLVLWLGSRPNNRFQPTVLPPLARSGLPRTSGASSLSWPTHSATGSVLCNSLGGYDEIAS
jgi:hypothetical protein